MAPSIVPGDPRRPLRGTNILRTYYNRESELLVLASYASIDTDRTEISWYTTSTCPRVITTDEAREIGAAFIAAADAAERAEGASNND